MAAGEEQRGGKGGGRISSGNVLDTGLNHRSWECWECSRTWRAAQDLLAHTGKGRSEKNPTMDGMRSLWMGSNPTDSLSS